MIYPSFRVTSVMLSYFPTHICGVPGPLFFLHKSGQAAPKTRLFLFHSESFCHILYTYDGHLSITSPMLTFINALNNKSLRSGFRCFRNLPQRLLSLRCSTSKRSIEPRSLGPISLGPVRSNDRGTLDILPCYLIILTDNMSICKRQF
jgi:hypothetical protein